uniref:Growth hormone-regulated TBC protein 1 n=1 Tax=Cacopsylla melanoneura TaxID=428564 RepID=A0A8D8SPQ0_9HEMI
MATSTFHEIDEYGFKRNETFDYAAYETFMSEYIGVLAKRAKKWTGILPLFTAKNNPAWAKSKKVKRYLRKGIPIDHRPQIWMIISNARPGTTARAATTRSC